MIRGFPQLTAARRVTTRGLGGTVLGLAVLSCLFLLGMAGCGTPENRRATLSRFFDGVPVPHKTNAVTVASASGTATNALSGNFSRPTSSGPPTTLVVSIHAPYANRQCQECHSERFSHALRAPRDQICLGCHTKTLADATVVHTPVRNGECLACHHPHTTESPHLLVKKNADLCLQCHDADLLSQVEGHQNAKRSDCVSCHDPHGGTREYLLRGVANIAQAPKS
jgi:predicted CXXCH cytochrome family protein